MDTNKKDSKWYIKIEVFHSYYDRKFSCFLCKDFFNCNTILTCYALFFWNIEKQLFNHEKHERHENGEQVFNFVCFVIFGVPGFFSFVFYSLLGCGYAALGEFVCIRGSDIVFIIFARQMNQKAVDSHLVSVQKRGFLAKAKADPVFNPQTYCSISRS